MAITQTSAVFTQGQGLPSSQSCSPGEYLIAGRCCKACPAGQHVGEHCRRPHSRGKCLPCLPRTFMKYLNRVEACVKCSTCSENEEVLEECMLTHDRVCQCPSGSFYAHVGSSEVCSPCSTCPTRHVVVRRCNGTADTVCRLPAPERRHRYSLFGTLGFALVMMCLNFWVRKRAGFPDGDAECMEMVTVVPGRERASSISPSSVQLSQNSVSSMPSNQDGSAESSVPTRGNPNQPEDSVDILTEAPAVTRALHSLEDVHGPQAVAGEGARALDWSPQPDPAAPAAPAETAELPTDLNRQDSYESGS
ncbi:tumor necrosis factor receptor superfamily member 22-like [Cervus elaphus]|uniref:tumor necrosis factor receptor superfamily member 22-like n=1 Tax=Cervus elaphus TaxID=9860 RepID=UPI001CC2CE5E|nr:tumor necrosis factor receptor superfamily member 22-like [Cervus elaphus]